MAENRKPENFGEVFFKSLGQGLGSLPGILETERQKSIQNMQLQMQAERFNLQNQESQARLSQANFNLIESQKKASLTPKQIGQREAEQQLGEIFGLGQGLIGDDMSGILGAIGAEPSLPQMRDLAQQQSGIDIFSGSGLQAPQVPFDVANVLPAGFTEDKIVHDPVTGKTTITYKPEASQQLDANTLIQQAQDEATKRGLIIDNINFNKEGGIQSVSLRQPPAEKPTTPAQIKEGERQEKKAIFAEAAEVYRSLPRDVKQKFGKGVGELRNFNDLSLILAHPDLAGQKRSLVFDNLYPDIEGLPKAFDQLQRLAEDYQNVGVSKVDVTLDEIDEAIRQKEAEGK